MWASAPTGVRGGADVHKRRPHAFGPPLQEHRAAQTHRGDPCGRPPLVLTPLGECVAEAIALTGVRVEHQVIMPNHVHLLLTLERAATRAAPTGASLKWAS